MTDWSGNPVLDSAGNPVPASPAAFSYIEIATEVIRLADAIVLALTWKVEHP